MQEIMGINVISFDPGKATGVAWWCEASGFHSEEIPDGWGGYYEWAYGWSSAPVPDVVTYESFVVNARTHKLNAGAFEDTTSIIGSIRTDARDFSAECFRQSPGEAKKFATDDKLRIAGFYNRTTGGHSNDAARHLLVRLFKLRVPEIMERFE